ncbi:MAG TPA: substrate-binding domain-containing protein [Alphaproteobacteria bacterium]|nr:substrate-binding domain-containing protein [Alphaproteobacteria bacterium]
MKTILRTLAVLALFAGANPATAADRTIRLASTTSTENSGLFSHLLPAFEARTGIRIHVIAVGTGQAIRLAKRGDADVLLVHHKPSEERFVREGFGVRRHDVMYNDFVLIGPAGDPAGIRGGKDVTAAFRKIANAKATFVSRGDDSGTHKKERGLWRAAQVDIKAVGSRWYRETGSGMGAALNTASGLSAYVLSDRATWIAFRNKGALDLLVEGDKRLFNQYGVILVNPRKHPHVKAKDGNAFIAWLTSADGQKTIAAFKVKGLQLFFPNAK